MLQAVQEEALEALHSNFQQQQQQQSSQQGGSSNPHASTARDTDSYSSSQSSSMHALLEKLYKHKLCALLQQHDTTLLRCTACSQLFASSSHPKLQCLAATNRYGSHRGPGRAAQVCFAAVCTMHVV